MAGTGQERPAATFFTEEATRQILTRISNVFDDPDLCDATFIVGDDNEKEEITAPSQFMALASPYFKNLFYPASGKELLFLQMRSTKVIVQPYGPCCISFFLTFRKLRTRKPL